MDNYEIYTNDNEIILYYDLNQFEGFTIKAFRMKIIAINSRLSNSKQEEVLKLGRLIKPDKEITFIRTDKQVCDIKKRK